MSSSIIKLPRVVPALPEQRISRHSLNGQGFVIVALNIIAPAFILQSPVDVEVRELRAALLAGRLYDGEDGCQPMCR